MRRLRGELFFPWEYMLTKVNRHRIESDPPSMLIIASENVIMPRPPSWIRTAIMIFPKRVKSLAVSITTSPVTHTADVDVKSALIKDMPDVVETGRQRMAAPDSINMRKLISTTWTGLLGTRKDKILLRIGMENLRILNI